MSNSSRCRGLAEKRQRFRCGPLSNDVSTFRGERVGRIWLPCRVGGDVATFRGRGRVRRRCRRLAPTPRALERPRGRTRRRPRLRLLLLVSGRSHRGIAGEADTSACRPDDRLCAAERTLATLFVRKPSKGFYLKRLTAHTSEARPQTHLPHRPQDLSESATCGCQTRYAPREISDSG